MAYITFIARDKYVASYQLDKDSVSLGRSFDADIFIPDVFVSRHHCLFERSDKGWMINDSDSRNGIFFKGARVKRRVLHHEDIVELGSIAFIFDEGDLASADVSSRTPFGTGSRVTELIDTLYAGESRPADYIRANGRQPKWAKAGDAAVAEVEEDTAVVLKEDDAGEWTELDMEWQIAKTEMELPLAAKFMLFGPSALGNISGISELLANNVDLPISSGSAALTVPANGAPGSFRAAAAAVAGSNAPAGGAGSNGNAAAGLAEQSPWGEATAAKSKAAEKVRKVRKPKRVTRS